MIKKILNKYLFIAAFLMTTVFSTAVMQSDLAHAASGGTIGSWQTQTSSLPSNLLAADSVTYDGYVYVLGGYDGNGPVNLVFSSQVDSNGNVGEWNGQGNTPLPIPLVGSSAIAHNGYIYIFGGGADNTDIGLQTVFSAPISNGIVGPWTLLNSNLPISLLFQTAVESDGYVYVMGGISGPGNAYPSDVVFSAQLNNDGTLGQWTTQANSLPSTSFLSSSVAYDGYIYFFGGENSQGPTNAVYSAPITNGTVGAWSTTQSLPAPLWGSTSVLYNGKVYLLGGGDDNSDYQNTVYSASLNSGEVSQWTNETNSLPQALTYSTSTIASGYVYVIGGAGVDGISNTVYSAQLYIKVLSQSANAQANTKNTVTILSNAIDTPDPSSLVILTQPTHGSATASPSGIVYTPTSGYIGEDSLNYKICSTLASYRCSLVTLHLLVAVQPPNTGVGVTLDSPLTALLDYSIASITFISAALLVRKKYQL
jgi:N-acetylneuraminic acid mutarotase